MAGTQDFRLSAFARQRVDNCGRYLGHNTYWKLYSIENYLRVILHSVLLDQIGSTWLDQSIDSEKKKNIAKSKKDYLKKPVHTLPGNHDVYYLYLSDLSKIMLANRHLILSLIPDVDNWVVKIEQARIPRNLIGHMNFPNQGDRVRIDMLHAELSGLVQKLEKRAGFTIRIP
jgi:hypothetical protein